MTKKIKSIMLNWEEYLIREYQPGWQPWANTIAYYPLDTDFKNTVTWTALTAHNSATIWTLGTVSCLDLTANNSYLDGTVSTLPQWNHDRTNIFWVSYTAFSHNPSYYYWTSWGWRADIVYSDTPIWWSQYWYTYNTDVSLTPADAWKWYLVAITISSWTVSMYVNWQYKTNTAWSWYTPSLNTNGTTLNLWYVPRDGRYLKWYLSKFIIEDKARTSQEISDYYNLTKWNYWL